MCEEATLVSFKVLDQHLPGGRIIETRSQDSQEVLTTGPQLL
jgi:hypothetical protein